jgi:CRISPR-associated protein Cas2
MMTAVCIVNAPERFHGYLRSLMMNVHPNLYVSTSLDKAARERVWRTLTEWSEVFPVGSITIISEDKTAAGGIYLRSIGIPKRDIVPVGETFGIRKALARSDRESVD